MFSGCRLLLWVISLFRLSLFILILPFVFTFEWSYTCNFRSTFYLVVRYVPRVRIEDRSFAYIGVRLQIMTLIL